MILRENNAIFERSIQRIFGIVYFLETFLQDWSVNLEPMIYSNHNSYIIKYLNIY